VGSNGETLYPALLRTDRELETFCAREDLNDYFFQEFVQGDSCYLLFYITRDRRAIYSWSQRNLLQQPHGKSMLLAEAHEMHRSPEAIRILELLRHANFHGLGMVELIASDRGLVFIEMNPRPWGPIQFCLDQRQPLLQAFLGDWLHGDPERYIATPGGRRRTHYMWLGGLMETLASGGSLQWHARPLPLTKLLGIAIGNDIYLRRDSWRCFLFELAQSARKALHVTH
jgi:hypothetical protein